MKSRKTFETCMHGLFIMHSDKYAKMHTWQTTHTDSQTRKHDFLDMHNLRMCMQVYTDKDKDTQTENERD